MTPQDILDHLERARLWDAPLSAEAGFDLPAAYACALQVRALRIARGEMPAGYKIGFTNRTIWARYNVFAPIWGTMWESTVSFSDAHGEGVLCLSGTCQPRLEPEIVFGLKAAPCTDPTPQQLFEAIDWIAPGFEVVQSHLPDWKFLPSDTVADGGLHARLLVGPRRPVQSVASGAQALDAALAQASVVLSRDGKQMESGTGTNVLGSPLQALRHFVQTLRTCEGAPQLQAGDVITTGTWTDAWPIEPGQRWRASFSLSDLAVGVRLEA